MVWSLSGFQSYQIQRNSIISWGLSGPNFRSLSCTAPSTITVSWLSRLKIVVLNSVSLKNLCCWSMFTAFQGSTPSTPKASPQLGRRMKLFAKREEAAPAIWFNKAFPQFLECSDSGIQFRTGVVYLADAYYLQFLLMMPLNVDSLLTEPLSRN